MRAQRLQASVLRWLCINAVVALFSYLGFRANVWKVHIFNGSSEGTINSQGAVFLSFWHNESSRGLNSLGEGGVGCENSVWGLEGGGWLWFWGHKRRVQLRWTSSRLGKAALRSALHPVFPALKNKPFKQTVSGMSVGFFKWNPIELGLNILKQNGSKFNYTLQAAWQFPLCNARSNKAVLNRPGTPLHTGVSVPRQQGRVLDKRPS